MALKALTNGTAKLPKISIKKQANVIGKNTVDAMNSGVYFGYIGLVKNIIQNIKDEYIHNMKVCFTGGLSSIFKDEIEDIDFVEKDLTLEGIKVFFDKAPYLP